MRINFDNKLAFRDGYVPRTDKVQGKLNQILADYLDNIFSDFKYTTPDFWEKFTEGEFTQVLWWRMFLDSKLPFKKQSYLDITFGDNNDYDEGDYKDEYYFEDGAMLADNIYTDTVCEAIVISYELFINYAVLLRNEYEIELREGEKSEVEINSEMDQVDSLITDYCNRYQVEVKKDFFELYNNLSDYIIKIVRPMREFEGITFPPNIEIFNTDLVERFNVGYKRTVISELGRLGIEVFNVVSGDQEAFIQFEFKFRDKLLKGSLDYSYFIIEGQDFNTEEYSKFSQYKGYDVKTKVANCMGYNELEYRKFLEMLKTEVELLEQYFNTKEIYPLGTVVYLKSESLKDYQLVVVERFIKKDADSQEYYEYKGTFYPAGSIEEMGKGICFNNEDIEDVIHMGYISAEDAIFVDGIFTVLATNGFKKDQTLRGYMTRKYIHQQMFKLD